jgi:hypothetical protein
MNTEGKVAVITGASQGIGEGPGRGVSCAQLPGGRDRAVGQAAER